MQLSDKYMQREFLSADITQLKGEIRLIESQIGLKGTDYTKLNVEGGKRDNHTENLIIKKCDLERDIERMEQQIELIDKCIQKYKDIAAKFGGEYLRIIELKELGNPVFIIANEIGLSESTVKRRLDKLGLVNKNKKK